MKRVMVLTYFKLNGKCKKTKQNTQAKKKKKKPLQFTLSTNNLMIHNSESKELNICLSLPPCGDMYLSGKRSKILQGNTLKIDRKKLK